MIFGAAGTSGLDLDNDLTSSAFNIAGITFSSGAAAFVIGDGTTNTYSGAGAGNAFALTGGITNSGTNLETINNPFSIAATQTFTTTAGGGNLTFGGAISGAGGITAAGAGTVTLAGADTYGGTTAVNAGTLNITGTSSGTGQYTMASGTTLTVASSGTVTLSRLTVAGGGGTINFNSGVIALGAGGINYVSGGVGLNFAGATLLSTAATSISGGLPINFLSGTSTIDTTGGNITSGSGFGNAASPGAVTIQGGHTLAAPWDAFQTGAVTVTGAGTTLQFNYANNAITSAVTINSGAFVDLGGDTNSLGGLVGAGSVINSSVTASTLTLNGVGGTFSGAIAPTTPSLVALTVSLPSADTQVFTGTSTYSGATNITSGTLELGANGNLTGATAVTVSSGATLAVTPGAVGTTTLGGSLTLNSGSNFTMADTAPSTLDVAGAASLAGAKMTFDLATNGSALATDQISITGAATVSNMNAIKINYTGAGVPTGSYTLLSDTAGGLTAPGDFTLTQGYLTVASNTYPISLVNSNNAETLVVGPATSISNVYYTGNASQTTLNATASAGAVTNFSSSSSGTPDLGAQPTSINNLYFTATAGSGATSPQTITSLGQSYALNSLNYTSNSPSISITDSVNNLTLYAGLTDASANNQSLNVPLYFYGTSQTISNSGAATLSLGGPITNQLTTLTTSGAGPIAIGGVMSGLGGFTIAGPGTVTVSAANTYTGATTVSGGVLAFGVGGGLGATAVTVASGATLAPMPGIVATNALGGSLTLSSGSNFSMADGAPSTLTVAGTAALAGANMTFDLASNGSALTTDLLAITGAATLSNINKITIDYAGAGAPNGNYTLISDTAGGLNSPNDFALTNAHMVLNGIGYAMSLVNSANAEKLVIAAGSPVSAYWTGAAGPAWNAGVANFNTSLAGGVTLAATPGSGSDVYYATTSPAPANLLTSSLGQAYTINSLSFLSTVGAVAITDTNALTINAGSPGNAGITDASSNPVSLNLPVVLAGPQTWTNSGSSTLTASDGVTAGSNALTIAGSGATTISGSAAFSTSAGFTVASGAGAFTVSAPVTVGASETWTNNSANTSTVSGNVNLGGSTLTLAGAGAQTLGGVISGSGGLTISATGLTTLSNANTFTGVVDINAGVVVNVASLTNYGVTSSLGARTAAAETASGDGIGIHIVNGTLQYTGATAQSTNRQIRIYAGTGNTIDASGSNPGATLSFTHSGSNINLYDSPGARTLNLIGSNTGANTFSIELTDQAGSATSLNKAGVGTWELNTTQYYGGPTTVSAGTLILGNGANIAAGINSYGGGANGNISNVTVSSGATLAVEPGVAAATNALAGSLTLNAGSNFTMADGIASTFNVAGAASIGAKNMAFDLGPSTADTLAAVGNATISSANETITIGQFGSGSAYTGPSGVTLISGGSGSTLNTNPISLTDNKVYFNGVPYTLSLTETPTAVTLNVTPLVGTDQAYWTGAAGSAWNSGLSNFNTSASGGTAISAGAGAVTDVYYATTSPSPTNLSSSLGQAYTINSLNFLSGVGAVTLTDTNSLTINADTVNNPGITDASANAVTLNLPIVLGGPQTWTNSGAATLTLGDGVTAGTNLLTFAGSGATTISGTAAYATSAGFTVASGAGHVTISASGHGWRRPNLDE